MLLKLIWSKGGNAIIPSDVQIETSHFVFSCRPHVVLWHILCNFDIVNGCVLE